MGLYHIHQLGQIAAAIVAAIALSTDMLLPAAQEDQRDDRAARAWPDNEPAGMTPIVFIDGSSKTWPGFGRSRPWTNDDRITVVDDPESKHGLAIEKRFFVGDRSGWNGHTWLRVADRGSGGYHELYFRMVFRFSPNWQYHTGMNKMFYWGSIGRPGNIGPTQFFLGIRGGRFQFVNQSASGESVSRGNFRANAPRISRDEYHTVEVLHVANTPGNSDGSARMWIDGVEVQSYTHIGHRERTNVSLQDRRWLDYSDTQLTGLVAFMFWGGQHDTKQVDDWIRLSELYVSGKR